MSRKSKKKRKFKYRNTKCRNTKCRNTKRKYNVGGLSWKSKTMKSFLLNNNIVKRIIKKLVTKKIRKTIWKRIIILFTSKTPRMKHLTRKTLIMKYKNDIVKLSNLINRDLTIE